MDRWIDMPLTRILQSQLDLNHLAAELKAGAVVLYPTETVAGIGSIGSRQKSVEQVFRAKKRDFDKPVSFAFSSIHMAQQYVSIPDRVQPLLSLFPGPVTLILPKKPDSSQMYGIDGKSIGVRIPDLPWLLQLIELVGEPIITTSANIAGMPSPSSVQELEKYHSVLELSDYLIEWEGSLQGTPSTVINCLGGKITIVREGAIDKNTIDQLVGI